MELPSHHRVPLGWLLEHGNETIRVRINHDLVDSRVIPIETLRAAEEAVVASRQVQTILKRQRDNGVWGANLLALAASARDGIKEPGTVPQYRRLLQLGYPRTGRAFKLSERILFRVLSRDADPFLRFEFGKVSEAGIDAEEWARDHLREGATAALAETGHDEDPRVRGAAHKIVSEVSQYLRSPLAEKPFVKLGARTVLDPTAHPPSWYSVAMLAAMPNLRRERAGFTDRLGQFLASPYPKRKFAVVVGKRSVKADYLLLGDPIESDAKGNPKDVPLALHFIELLARIGVLHTNQHATKVLGRLLADCDEMGVWRPKNLRSAPSTKHHIVYHWYPLNPATKDTESRSVDVTFRLALIAKHLGWQLEYV